MQITPQTTFKQWLKANHHGNPRAQKLLTDNAIPDRWVVDMGDLDEILKARYPDGELTGFDVDQLWFDYREQMMEAGANPFAQYVEMVADEARFGHREDLAANLADEFLAEEHVLQHRFETIEDYIARRPELEDSVAPILEDLYIEWCVRYTEAHIQDCISGEAEPEDSPAVTPVGEMRKNSKDQYDMGEYAGTVYQHKDSYYSYLDGQSGMEGPFPTFEQAMGDLQTRVNL